MYYDSVVRRIGGIVWVERITLVMITKPRNGVHIRQPVLLSSRA